MKNKHLMGAWDSANPSQSEKDRMLGHIIQQAIQPTLRFQPRRVLALTLALVVVLGATAFALNEGGLINWFGKETIEDLPILNEDEDMIATIQERAHKAKELMAGAPEDELWVAEIWEKTQIVHSPYKEFNSAPALAAHLASAGLAFPAQIPTAYSFISGGITPYLSENTVKNGLLPLADQQADEGFLIKKYRVTTDYAKDIDSWYAEFSDDNGNVLALICSRDSHSSQYSFSTSTTGEHDVLTLPGLSETLYIRNKDGRFEHSLNLRQTGLPRLFHYNWEAPGEIPDINFELNYYDTIVYRFESNALGKDALTEIATSLK